MRDDVANRLAQHQEQLFAYHRRDREVGAPIDTSNPSGRLIFQMLTSFAEYERETIRERTRASLHRAYRGGKHFGAAPYGYRTDEGGSLQVVPEEAEIVREIIENVTEGSTLYGEAKRLNDLGLATLDGATATATSARAPSYGPS